MTERVSATLFKFVRDLIARTTGFVPTTMHIGREQIQPAGRPQTVQDGKGKDMIAADRLREEIRVLTEAGNDPERRGKLQEAWMQAAVVQIEAIRFTDYQAARALLAELEACPVEFNPYRARHVIAKARNLIRDRQVKLAHGLVKEVLKPITLGSEATAIPDGMRASRITAEGTRLAQVGRGVHCRELLLAGAAIESLPDDIAVSLRLDVSQCLQLKRLPDNLKVGTLLARECTALEALPAGLQVSYLDVTGCTGLAALPGDLVVRHGRLSVRDCPRLTALPVGLGPLAYLDIAGCLNITTLPADLAVTSWIDIGGSGVRALPPHLADVGLRWRGVPVDERIAFRPETLDHREILAQENAERRRVMMERMGLDRFMAEAGAQVLDQDTDAGGPRRLLRIELPGDEPLVCVSVVCPTTQHQFMLRVPPAMATCRQAVAWTAGFEIPDDYKPRLET